MIKIQDVIVPTKGTGKYLNVRVLPFDLTPTSGIQLYWAIQAEMTSTDPEGVETTAPGQVLLEGNLHMPQEQYELWGTDDTFVIEWAATQLNLTLITETTETTETI
jgi:hypothetical protein